MALVNIVSFAQQISDAIASILDVEVTIVDNNGNRVVGTGCFKEKIGELIPKDFGLLQAISKKSVVFFENSSSLTKCENCLKKKECSGTTLLASPIITQGDVWGAIGLIGFYQYQKERIFQRRQGLVTFLNHMCNLLGSKINEQYIMNQLDLNVQKLNELLQSLPEGVLEIDRNGFIQHFNKAAGVITNIAPSKVVGKKVDDVLTGLELDGVCYSGKGYIDQPKTLQVGMGKKVSCYATASPIKDHAGNVAGVVVILKSVQDIHRIVQRVTSESIITFDNIIGISTSINDVKQKAIRASRGKSTILLFGESGTGKELFARAIHSESPLSNGPFVTVNCAAIPETLLESELFGYEDGAFTGARKGGKPGKFELANKGTIFLDEIGDMPLSIQAKLLRVLEDHMIERIGGSELNYVDVRVLSATNRDLRDMVKHHQFREDLFYRINVIPINIPPLRERKEDLPLLMEHFLLKNNMQLNKTIKGFSAKVSSMLNNYSWPGNIRELRNVIEYAVNMETGSYIEVFSLPESFIENYNNTIINKIVYTSTNSKPIYDLERLAIEQALKEYGTTTEGKIMAAKALGISYSTLYRRLKLYNIKE